MQNGRGARPMAAACVAVACPGAVIFSYPGVLGAYWRVEYGVSRAAVGATLFFLLAAVGSCYFPVGRWLERSDPRRLVLAGQVLCATSLAVAAFSPTMRGIYLWAFLVGASSSLVHLPALAVAQVWYPERRGLATGAVNFCFAVSAAALSPVFGWLLARFGYVHMNLALAALLLVVGGAASRSVVLPEAGSAPARAGGAPSRSLTATQALRTRSFWFLWATWAAGGAAGISLITFSFALGAHKRFTPEGTVALLTTFNLSSGVSRLAMGYLSDRSGRRVTLALAFALAGAAYLGLSVADGVLATATLAAVIGLAFGTLFTVSAPLVVECFGAAHFAAVLGLVFTAYGYLSGVLGPWWTGVLVDRAAGDPTAACFYLAALCALTSVFVLGVKPPPSRS
jgi:MFS transporter, OFA family, oxalate/formate antiporter